MTKMPKDARQSVRYNSEVYEKLKAKGWTVQSLLDWAIDQHSTTETKTTIAVVGIPKKGKSVPKKG